MEGGPGSELLTKESSVRSASLGEWRLAPGLRGLWGCWILSRALWGLLSAHSRSHLKAQPNYLGHVFLRFDPAGGNGGRGSRRREKMGKKKEAEDSAPRHWLLKTEPSEWSWADQAAAENGTALWDGVKNKQAQKNMKSMSPGDLCFFYHSGSGPGSRRVIGAVEVVRGWSDGDEAVEVRAVGEMRRAVGLGEMKERLADRKSDFGLLRQPRLSVVPVDGDVWARVCEMGGGYAGDGTDDVA